MSPMHMGTCTHRYAFLLGYSILNLVLFWEAYARHMNSPKGRALRGENFWACASGTPPGLNASLPAQVGNNIT